MRISLGFLQQVSPTTIRLTTITTMMSAPYPQYPASPPATVQYVPRPPDAASGAHPFLREPKLYISNLSPLVTDVDLAHAFEYCVPFRPTVIRDGTGQPVNGYVEFKHLERAEKALATLNGSLIPNTQFYLHLSPFASQATPPPLATPRLVKHLPHGTNDSFLYDLFRPYGPLSSAKMETTFGAESGIVHFWNEDDAAAAEQAMHCAEVGDRNIAVVIFQQPRRTASAQDQFSPNASAPPFVPGMPVAFPVSASTSPHRSPHSPPSPFVHGPGQQVQYAPQGTGSHSGLIDPCNLFCKNLDPEIDSNKLFTHFKPYGQIVSARVMRNDSGQSRGFGFVSFQAPEQATAALQAMNGVFLGSKQIAVRLHEPKQLRQEKLQQRFSPRTRSGTTSPTPSDGADSLYSSFSPDRDSIRERAARRISGSYYTAALNGTLNMPMQFEELSALSPIVRREVLTGELTRRLKTTDSVQESEVDALVEAMVSMDLKEIVNGIQNSKLFADQLMHARQNVSGVASNGGSPPGSDAGAEGKSRYPLPSSAPEHPSTPVSLAGSRASPPRTSSPSGSAMFALDGSKLSERDRLARAVSKIEPKKAQEITDLLLSLNRKERALCLFNTEYLRSKVTEAKDIIEVLNLDEKVEDDAAQKAKAAPTTPKKSGTGPATDLSPHTPDLSSRGPSAAASPTPTTPSHPTVHTLATLAKLSASEIVMLAGSPSATGLPLPKADPTVVKSTDDWIDGLQDKTLHQQKQTVGDKLFRVIKAFGIKQAPKLTIALLDREDLRALAHLMNSYPAVLKEKVLLTVPELKELK
ncbi:Polyadenylate-binding protein, cytoplasmic and nuclear [Rhizoctonia solani]|uniref:Polyadenylate-binding protein, cytoplasmic and nuclear n=1 Tax=Rhizoctonia solani TaxID=456999 RepID=A0A0K6GEI1_9AGAM|nr:Polyadenylate-binding protein, cytoplasmic and nuclear [Rhizoctonia solani]